MKTVSEKAKETQLFLRRVVTQFNSVGALLPTSPGTAKALSSDANRHLGPKTILEVGPGTGPVTTQLVKHLKPGDKLVLCELDPGFADYLRKRFEKEPLLARVRDQVEILNQSVVDMPGEAQFDFVISTLPFSRLPAPLTEQILATYQRLLKPGGVFTYLEYAFVRLGRKLLSRTENAKANEEIVSKLIANHQFRVERVMWNVPPALVRSLRFSEAKPEDALKVGPRWKPHRFNLEGAGVIKEAFDLIAGLGAMAFLLRGKGVKAWPLPLAGALAAAWFHRDPERFVHGNLQVAYSACDGKVMKVDKIRHPRLGDQEWLRVATFLSPMDVHMNRAPIAGRVHDSWEEPGGFMPAYKDESELNSSRFIVIEGPQGKCAVAQRAGFLARRIITWAGRGELLAQGETYGLIRLGSRTDLLVPADKAEIVVKPGDRLVAGETVVARWL